VPTLLLLLSAATDPLSQLREGGLELSLLQRATGLLGIAAILAIAWLLSYDRRRVPWRLVGMGLLLQATFGVLVLKTTPGRWFFSKFGDVVKGLLDFSNEGAHFIFGDLIANTVPVGTPGPGDTLDTTAGFVAHSGSYFAFGVLPTIIFFSSLMTVLYYLGVMQMVVKGLAWVMQRTLRTSGAETLSASGNIFLGQTEAPLLIKPFVAKLTSSELFTVMVGGFATVAGGVLAAYVAVLQGFFPDIAGHLLAASVMNAPAGLLLSKIIRPETETPMSRDALHVVVEKTDANVVEAAASGAATGVQLALNVGGMLIAFIALIAMVNFGIGWAGNLVGIEGLSLQVIFGVVLRPLTWVMGVPWHETGYVGGLIGLKVVLTEFVAYVTFAADVTAGTVVLSPRATIITAYALLGFANFASIGIQIGGIGGLAPSRRGDLARFGLRAMVAGNLAAFMSATLAGMIL
jgi:CNT family concentrative nucleoside transporter